MQRRIMLPTLDLEILQKLFTHSNPVRLSILPGYLLNTSEGGTLKGSKVAMTSHLVTTD